MIEQLRDRIRKPHIWEIMALEHDLKGYRKELAEEVFSVYDSDKSDDPGTLWRLSNMWGLFNGLKRMRDDIHEGKSSNSGTLRARLISFARDGFASPIITNMGLISVDVVTDGGVKFVTDAMAGLETITNVKWHQSGTTNHATTPESAGQNDLVTPIETRVSGSQGKFSDNVYETIATLSYPSGPNTVREHGIFWASTGTFLYDRSAQFTEIPVDTNVNIEFTYRWTLQAGG